MAVIDRRALPLRVRDMIVEQIRSGALPPGSQLPTETALGEQYGVGRSTVREAVKLLVNDGIVEVQHGRGSFVTGMAGLATERPITRFESVTEMMAHLGYTVENRVLSVTEPAATQEEAAELGLKAGDPVIRLERLRLHEGKPFVFSVNVVPRALFDGPLDQIAWGASIIDLLDERDREVVASSAHMRATRAPEPWLLITETCVTATGEPVLIAHDYHRGDAFAFHVVRRRLAD
jgi:GntR family transcriptional regulator